MSGPIPDKRSSRSYSRRLDVSVSRRGLAVRVAAVGEIDIATAQQLYDAFADRVMTGAQTVVADLTGVTSSTPPGYGPS